MPALSMDSPFASAEKVLEPGEILVEELGNVGIGDRLFVLKVENKEFKILTLALYYR